MNFLKPSLPMSAALILVGITLTTVSLVGCTSTPSDVVVQKSVAEMKVALTAAENAALRYATLPPCVKSNSPVTSGSVLCSDKAVLAKIGKADNIAFAAVKAAGVSAAQADVTAANTAVAALVAVIPVVLTTNN